MAGLNTDEDLGFLVGKEIVRIAFEPSGVHFIWFDEGELHAKVFEHRAIDGSCTRFGDGCWRDPPSLLHRIVQRVITSVVLTHHSLKLCFDDGQSLEIFGQDGLVENGMIMLGSELSDGYIIL